jgi:hypothetical protein
LRRKTQGRASSRAWLVERGLDRSAVPAGELGREILEDFTLRKDDFPVDEGGLDAAGERAPCQGELLDLLKPALAS